MKLFLHLKFIQEKQPAKKTVEGYTVQKHPKFEIYADKAGEFRFRLKATNGEIIGVSEGYKALKSAENGIASVQKNAPDADVVKE